MTFDVVIVGAGSAGCVLAARLSENRGRSVLLLEAGPDYPSEADLPPEVRSGFNPTSTHDWAAQGNPGWSFSEVLPYFRKLERDADFDDEWLGRTNLTIRAACQVDRVMFDGHRATGVRLVRGNEAIPAHRIILAAGTFGSPAILLRSGIGPARPTSCCARDCTVRITSSGSEQRKLTCRAR